MKLKVFVFLFSLTTVASPMLWASPTKQEYRKHIAQQLTTLDHKIERLRYKRNSMKGAAHDRLAENIRMLQGKLDEARAILKSASHADSSHWPVFKKELDAKVVRLNKSYNYVLNTLRQK